MVIVAVPVCPVTEVIVAVLFPVVPDKTILAFGIKVVLLELAVIVKLFNGVSVSFTVKFTDVGFAEQVEISLIADTVGLILT